jgi:hypothetical protein
VVPMALPAPGRFCTVTGWPSSRLSASAKARATRSVPPPAPKGTMSVTGWLGNFSWA